MTILITGGAGYIGSHMVHASLERGEDVLVLDNLSTGVRSLVADGARFYLGNVGDQSLLRKLMSDHRVTAVLHFAGSTVVPDSLEQPLAYYANNMASSRSLIEVCAQTGVKHVIFSSSAAVYATPAGKSVSEESPVTPNTPYGRSKLMTEWILEDAARAHDFGYVTLRYFNVTGADPSGRTGQSTPHATHLVKRACQAALGRIPQLEIFGTNFGTDDGTGVRDYVHVTDLVQAHAAALDYLRAGGSSLTLNCGCGRGVSVRQVIAATAKVAGHSFPTVEAPARPGDIAEMVADSTRLQRYLAWRPRYGDLQTIVATAYEWEKRLTT